MKLSAPSDKDIILKPIQPNLGVEAAYRKSLKKLLREMRTDVQDLLKRHYPKGIAQDSLTDGLQAALAALLRYWLARLDKLAPQIAEVFANRFSAFESPDPRTAQHFGVYGNRQGGRFGSIAMILC